MIAFHFFYTNRRIFVSKFTYMYALVDGNNFYASCERVFNPALRDKPIVVLSNNDGIIIARSNEAKALGIAMGTPAFEIKDLIARHQVIAFSSNYALYGDMSQRMMQIFQDFTPGVEIYSIDEAFLDFTGFNADIFQHLFPRRQNLPHR